MTDAQEIQQCTCCGSCVPTKPFPYRTEYDVDGVAGKVMPLDDPRTHHLCFVCAGTLISADNRSMHNSQNRILGQLANMLLDAITTGVDPRRGWGDDCAHRHYSPVTTSSDEDPTQPYRWLCLDCGAMNQMSLRTGIVWTPDPNTWGLEDADSDDRGEMSDDDGPYGPGIEVKFDDEAKELPKHLYIANECLNNTRVGETGPRPGEPWEFYLFGHRDAPDGPHVFVVVVGGTEEQARGRLERFSNRDDVTVLESAEDDDQDDCDYEPCDKCGDTGWKPIDEAPEPPHYVDKVLCDCPAGEAERAKIAKRKDD